jgi:putative addiction module component (TIGR02574 family)
LSLVSKETKMPDTAADLVKRGRLLPPQEREILVDGLLESLNEPAAKELHAAWEAEIEQRLAAYDRGEVQAISASEVFARARAIAR